MAPLAERRQRALEVDHVSSLHQPALHHLPQ
jgi:hypothetical protein